MQWTPTFLGQASWEQIASAARSDVGTTVVIPVFNGGQVVARCIESCVRHSLGTKIIIIDDGSTDRYTTDLLDSLEADGKVQVVRHPENWGYTRTANHALALAGRGDVVLLNSDAEVGPNWIGRLRAVAYSRADVATVSAVSDNAGAMSVPQPGIPNDWPSQLTWDENARHLSRSMPYFSQVIPTAHGFCMYIRGDAIDAIGGFDEDLFPRGYGEENDFSRRAADQGYVNLLAPHVLVRHERSASFGSEQRAALVESGVSAVVGRHPDYQDIVHDWMRAAQTREIRSAAKKAYDSGMALGEVKPRVLYVLHRAGGGTPQTNMDLIRNLPDQESYLLEAVSGKGMVLSRVEGGIVRQLESWFPSDEFKLTDEWRKDYAAFLASVLIRYSFELVHVRHLINQPLSTLPQMLSFLGIYFVLSTHDFYYVCPSVHLVDENSQFCGGKCTPGVGRCSLPTPFLQQAPENLKHEWVNEWRVRVQKVLDAAHVVVATTDSAADLYRRTYPSVASKLVQIEHGRDLEVGVHARSGTRKPGPLRILAAAQWDPHKGVEYIRSLAQEFDGRIEWHILGVRGETLADVGIVHGRYEREAFPKLAREIDPDLVAVFATWPETYSHTLTEAWALGVPVIANDIGAVADRIRKHGGGVVLPYRPDHQAIRHVERLLSEGLADVPTVQRGGIRSTVTMAEDYRTSAYGSGIDDTPLIGVVSHPGRGSSFVRTGGYSRAANLLGLARVRRVVVDDLISGSDVADYDAILVQRDAVPGGDSTKLVTALRDRGVRLAFEIDDDLLSPSARARILENPDYSLDRLDGMETILRESDVTIVSTNFLAGVLSDFGVSNVRVIENRLDPRSWETSVPSVSSSATRPVYIGNASHAQDLELISELPAMLSERVERKVLIDVVGVTRGALPRGYVRVDVPRARYPEFVRWVRSQRSRWNVGLAPLAPDELNLSKSDLKLLEYSALGLSSVASDRGPYKASELASAVVGDDIEEWVDAVLHLAGSFMSGSRAPELNKRPMLRKDVELWCNAVLGRSGVSG